MSTTTPRAVLTCLWAADPPDEATAASLRALGIDDVVSAPVSAALPDGSSSAVAVRWDSTDGGFLEVRTAGAWRRAGAGPGTTVPEILGRERILVVTTGSHIDRLRQCRRVILDGLSGVPALDGLPRRPICSDDLPIGTPIVLGTTVLTAADILRFAEQWDPLDMHIDEEWADETPIGGLCASGVHLMSIAQRVMSEHFLRHVAVVAGRGLREMRIFRPGRPGDELTVRVTVREVVTRPSGRDLVTTSVWMGDEAGAVLEFTGESVMLRRSALQTITV